ncbi:hypothetical protein ABI59_15270 [Acidobacteria bacterium Mor1]|nr:hypothetical protein ABI59_15270 [Acidobacteria bacterium Mor1]
MKTHSAFFALISLLALFGVSSVSAKDKVKELPYDHSSGKNASFQIALKAGEEFILQINKTAKECFDYNVEKVERAPEPGEQGDDGITTKNPIKVTHDGNVGGYIFNITKIEGRRPAACSTAPHSELENAVVIVAVSDSGADVDFGGGFTISELTSPVFGSRDDGSGQDVIFRDDDAEDATNLGVAAFIHVRGKNWGKGYPSLSFGLGVSDASETTYYAGPFWRIGKQAYIGGGIAFGSVDRLPAGVRAGDPITDPGVLGNLGSRTDTAAFIGFSYTFLGNENAFKKPFTSVSDANAEDGKADSQ